MTRNLRPVWELLVTETEHNNGKIARVLLRFPQRGLIGLNVRLTLRRGLVRLFGNVQMSLLATGAHSIFLH